MKNKLSQFSSFFVPSFWKHYVAWSFLIISVFMVFYIFLFHLNYNELFYVDSDSYTRALRISDWLQNFQWQEKIFPYGNYPDGFILHFTRICDIIWLVFALPFMLFLPLKEAIFYGGFCFSPLFLFLTLTSVLWGVKPYLEKMEKKEAVFLSIFVFSMLFCCKLSHAFDFYRPDHHGLMCFVFSYVIAAVLRSYIKESKTEMFTAGILTGCGLWASSAPEGLYIAGVVLLVLSIDVVFCKQSTQNPLYYALGFFYACLAAWLINPPYGGWFVLDNTRLSIIHVVISAFILLSFAAWHFGKFNGTFKQLLSLGGFTIISFLALILLFGSRNIFAPVYEEHVLKYFIPYITEMRPVNNFLLCPVLAGMLITSYFSVRNPYERSLGILYFITSFTGALISRFYPYFLSVWITMYAYGLIILMGKKDEDNKYKIAAFLYIICPIFYLSLFDYEPLNETIPEVHGVVLADTFSGPELIWYKNVDTVASPYHTNIEGIIDNRTMWFTSDENELKELLKKRKVTYITLFDITKSIYYPEQKKKHRQTVRQSHYR